MQSQMALVGENVAISTAKEYYYNGNISACTKAADMIAGYHGYRLTNCEIKETAVELEISMNALAGVWKLKKNYRAGPLFGQTDRHDIISSLEKPGVQQDR